MAAAVERLVVEGEQFLRDVVAHHQREHLGDVAVLGEEQVQLLPPPGHVAAPALRAQGHLGVITRRLFGIYY